MGIDEHGTYHGDISGECGWTPWQTFTCPNCKRTICYCGGAGECNLCDDCCVAADYCSCAEVAE